MCFRRPQSLTQLTFLTVQRANFNDQKYGEALKIIKLPTHLKRLPQFIDTKTIKNEQLQKFIESKKPANFKTRVRLFFYRFVKLFMNIKSDFMFLMRFRRP